MLLDYHRIKKAERELRILFKTTPAHGTYWNFVKEGLKKFNLNFDYSKSQTLEVVERLIKNKIPVVVSVNAKMIGGSEDVNHTVVVIGINEEYVMIHDPEIGAEVKIKRDKFSEAWSARRNRIGYIVEN